MPKLLFFPDQPIMSSPDRLPIWDEKGTFICQQKVDGWRMVFQFLPDNKGINQVVALSRHNKDYTKEVMEDPQVCQELLRLAKLLPADTHLDGEWLSRRSCSKKHNLKPMVFFFDILVWGGVKQNKTPYGDRWNSLHGILTANVFGSSVVLAATAKPGQFVQFYEDQKKIPFSEGVVCKHVNSTMVARSNRGADNRQWYKLRYRGGVDGDVDMDQFYGG